MSGLTKEQLRNELINHGIELPSSNARKSEYVELYEKHVAPVQQSKGDFSSDEEDLPNSLPIVDKVSSSPSYTNQPPVNIHTPQSPSCTLLNASLESHSKRRSRITVEKTLLKRAQQRFAREHLGLAARGTPSVRSVTHAWTGCCCSPPTLPFFFALFKRSGENSGWDGTLWRGGKRVLWGNALGRTAANAWRIPSFKNPVCRSFQSLNWVVVFEPLVDSFLWPLLNLVFLLFSLLILL